MVRSTVNELIRGWADFGHFWDCFCLDFSLGVRFEVLRERMGANGSRMHRIRSFKKAHWSNKTSFESCAAAASTTMPFICSLLHHLALGRAGACESWRPNLNNNNNNNNNNNSAWSLFPPISGNLVNTSSNTDGGFPIGKRMGWVIEKNFSSAATRRFSSNPSNLGNVLFDQSTAGH